MTSTMCILSITRTNYSIPRYFSRWSLRYRICTNIYTPDWFQELKPAHVTLAHSRETRPCQLHVPSQPVPFHCIPLHSVSFRQRRSFTCTQGRRQADRKRGGWECEKRERAEAPKEGRNIIHKEI